MACGFLLKLFDQLAHLVAVKLGTSVTKLFLESIAQGLNIAVLAEDEGNHQPIIARAHLTVGAMVAIEGARSPARHVWRRPDKFSRFGTEAGGIVLHISSAQQTAARNWLADQPDFAAIHDDLVTIGEIAHGKFVLSRNVRLQDIVFAREM